MYGLRHPITGHLHESATAALVALLCLSAWPASAQTDDGWGPEHQYNLSLKEIRQQRRQDKERDSTELYQETQFDFSTVAAYRSGHRLPFYMTSSQHGVLSPEHSQGYVRGQALYRVGRGKWNASAGADLIAYASSKSDYYGSNVYLQQLYARINYSMYHFTLGAIEQQGEFVDPKLSSGNMIYSGNARPGIGLHVGMEKFASMVICDNLLEGKIDVSWTRLTDGDYTEDFYHRYEVVHGKPSVHIDEDGVQHLERHITDARQHARAGNTWIHHKSAFLRTKSTAHFFLTAGIEHSVMYAGKVNGVSNTQGGGWFRASVGSKGKTTSGYNHMLSYDFRGDLNFSKWKLGAYKQHYTDDMTGGLRDSGMDGLWGLELRLPRVHWLNHIVLEYLCTTNQSGVVYANDVYSYDNTLHPEAGNSNFYHDESYGPWANYNMGLGNPLLMSPIYNDDYYPDYQSNMIRVVHIGLTGRIAGCVDYTLKAHRQESWGSPFAPYLKARHNTSAQLEVNYVTDHWQFSPAVALDRGDLMGNNFGVQLQIIYEL